MTAFNKPGQFLKGALTAAGIGLVAAGCSTSTSFVNYSENNLYSSDNTGNMPYVEVGPVHARESGFIWQSCDALIEGALEQAREEAEDHAANALIGVRWLNHAEGTWHDTPRCTTQWGWFAAAGVGGLAPWVKVAEFEGRLAYVEEGMMDKVLEGQSGYAERLEEQRQAELREKMRERREQERREREAAEAEQENEADGEDAE